MIIVIVTTLNPQLGIVEYDDGRKITIADIPGVVGWSLIIKKKHKFCL